MIEFKKLRADEIECLVQLKRRNDGEQPVYANAMLYMKARTPMAKLDEAVGPENWKAEFVFLNATNAMCNLSIYIKERNEWVTKHDVGAVNEGMGKGDDQGRANQVKSLTSDALKRAAVMWGIGRELYTGPKPIEFPLNGNVEVIKTGNGWKTFDRFNVTGISYDDKDRINFLQIADMSTRKVVYTYDARPEKLTEEELEKAKEAFRARGIDENEVCKVAEIKKFEDLTRSVFRNITSPEGMKAFGAPKVEKTIQVLPNAQKKYA